MPDRGVYRFVSIGNLAMVDQRRVGRDEVLYRTRGNMVGGHPLKLVIVNISPCGLMARCDAALAEGDTIHVVLPHVGVMTATIRWSLGGRLGCEFDRVVPLADYYDMLSIVVKG